MQDPARIRPKMFPPPEFPPRKPARFARTPPAVFPPILGLLGLGLALKRGLGALDMPTGMADAALGAVAVLWAFAVFAYLAKLARRPRVLAEDMGSLPGRAGLAAATMGGMLMAAVLAPFAPAVALGLLWVALLAHAALAGMLARLLLRGSAPARSPNPTLHLSFVGFIVGGVGAAALGQDQIAVALLYATMPVAALIWGLAAVDFARVVPPAPLRPLLAIHLAPAALLSTVAALTGQAMLAQGFALLAAALLAALVLGARWLLASGFSALWGALTFPLASTASALILTGWTAAGLAVLAAALVVVPWIAWRVLSLWPGNRLAAKTNAAEA
ncbi:MAG: hypothetical protein RIR62_3037 [Pseudomonadota bacterium]